MAWRRGLEAWPGRGAVGGGGSKAPLQDNCADLSEELEPFFTDGNTFMTTIFSRTLNVWIFLLHGERLAHGGPA